MMRLIDADELYSTLEEVRQDYLEEDTYSSNFAAEVIKAVQDEYLSSAPTIDAEQVRHGRWLTWEEILHVDKRAPNNLGVFCSMCNKHSDNMTNYCPVCGAEMDGGDEND